MTLNSRRPLACVVFCLVLIPLSGLSSVFAAGNLLHGEVSAPGLPAEASVRATPIEAGDPEGGHGARLAPILADGTYRFSDLPAGAYALDVVVADGSPFVASSGAAPVAAVPAAGVAVANLALVGAEPQEGDDDDGSNGGGAKGGGGAPVGVWIAVGIVVAAIGVATLSGNSKDEDDCDPAASPAVPCP